MDVRQYIGARYVLKIYENSQDAQSAEWEAGVAYEPLTMVNYNNSSYISRKDVPGNIGNPVDNPTYWALSGLYNGQIAALQEQLNELDDTVDSMVNNVAKNKYAGKSVIRKNILQRPDYLKTLADTAENCSLQGAAYNSTRNTYLIAILEDSGIVTHLVEISMGDGITVVKRESFGDHILGHANDITYNPNTDLYYVCTLAEGNVNNEAVAIDADTLEIVDTIQLYPNTTIQQEGSMCIAYDEINDRYFSMSQYAIYVYDSEFNIIKTIDYPLLTSYIASNFGYSQGVVNAICAYKGFVCLGIFGWDPPGEESGICLALVDVESGETFTTWNIDSNSTYEELEGLFVKGEDIYMVSGQAFYNLSRIVVQGHPTFDKANSAWGGGKIVPAGADLNDIYSPGRYYVSKDALHTPTSTATGEMEVTYYGTLCIQKFWSFAADRQATLYRYTNGNAWTAWTYQSPWYRDDVQAGILINDLIVPGFITDSSKEIVFSVPLTQKVGGAFSTSLVASGAITCRYSGSYLSDGWSGEGSVMRIGQNAGGTAGMTVTTNYSNNGYSILVRVRKLDGTAFKTTSNGSVTNNSPLVIQTGAAFTLTHNV